MRRLRTHELHTVQRITRLTASYKLPTVPLRGLFHPRWGQDGRSFRPLCEYRPLVLTEDRREPDGCYWASIALQRRPMPSTHGARIAAAWALPCQRKRAGRESDILQ